MTESGQMLALVVQTVPDLGPTARKVASAEDDWQALGDREARETAEHALQRRVGHLPAARVDGDAANPRVKRALAVVARVEHEIGR